MLTFYTTSNSVRLAAFLNIVVMRYYSIIGRAARAKAGLSVLKRFSSEWQMIHPLTWLRISVAFLALIKSGVSVAKANIPLPFISCSNAFLYSLCEGLKSVKRWSIHTALKWNMLYMKIYQTTARTYEHICKKTAKVILALLRGPVFSKSIRVWVKSC